MIVPGIEMVGKRSPSNSELRYFRKAEQDRAQQIVDQMRRSGAEIGLTYVRGHEDSNKIRPLHFELWLTDNSLGYWFPVVASITDREKAIAEARRIEQIATALRYEVQLYQATNAKGQPVYAVTLGAIWTRRKHAFGSMRLRRRLSRPPTRGKVESGDENASEPSSSVRIDPHTGTRPSANTECQRLSGEPL